jgi:hypothetical protein
VCACACAFPVYPRRVEITRGAEGFGFNLSKAEGRHFLRQASDSHPPLLPLKRCVITPPRARAMICVVHAFTCRLISPVLSALTVQNETTHQPWEAHRKPAHVVLHTYSCCLDIAHARRSVKCAPRVVHYSLCGAVWSLWSCGVICDAVLCSLPRVAHTTRHARLMMVVLRGWEVRGQVTEFSRYDACPPTHLI